MQIRLERLKKSPLALDPPPQVAGPANHSGPSDNRFARAQSGVRLSHEQAFTSSSTATIVADAPSSVKCAAAKSTASSYDSG